MKNYIHLLLISVSFFWGTSFAAAKIGMAELHPLNLVILRFIIASIIFGLILLRRRDRTLELRDIPTFLILGFIGITSYFYIQFTGLQYTTTIHSALIIATGPIIVGIISVVLHIEKINKSMVWGIAMAFSGVALVISGGDIAEIFQAKTIKGDLMLFSNAIVWAGFTLYGKKILIKYSPLLAMAYIHIFGTLLLLPLAVVPSIFAPVTLAKQIVTLSWPTVTAVLYLAVFCSVFSYYVWYEGVEKIGAVRTAVFGYFNPLFASLTGVLLLNEKVTAVTIFGGCLVMLGVYLTSELKQTKPTQKTNIKGLEQP
ncbi:DMT family transporter [Desulfotomaculum sp. 1211_IL3151]|uniref:DMT family transporter n=1 Tax=Desulfotomaculum sp. 1211_IL3151 TaxID=3084055 RepID=UPI002FDA8B72